MDLTRKIASLGLSARESAQLKVRQPLARALVHAGEGQALDEEYAEIVRDELNVKAVTLVNEAGELVDYKLLPNLKLLGRKLGKLVPATRTALAAANAIEIVASIEAGQSVSLTG
jgi:isoleucyl-tRNA synthetase